MTMTTMKLALRNLLGAGTKTWLKVAVLSLTFVMIVGLQGLYQGMSLQASQAMVAVDIAGGQYWHEHYDPQDPLQLPDAHGPVPPELDALVEAGKAASQLAVQGFVFAAGTFRPVVLKGIDPQQTVLSLPTAALAKEGPEAPALIGTRMARDTGLKVGDLATVRWRDARGTFDAEEIRIVEVMNTSVQTVDSGQIWLPLERLRRMARMESEATLIVLARDTSAPRIAGWDFKSPDFLLTDLTEMVRMKNLGGSVGYMVLLFLAMLAIFDTQVLSIFHRRKEIGTLMALGLTRGAVIRMFTMEGAFNAVLAALVGAAYGIPLLGYLATAGVPLPASFDAAGFALGEKMYPAYSAMLVVVTTAVVLTITTIVSYLPTRQISRLKPTDALRGRLA
jgi:ABC-type lipoprotein release transport system permease subunit